MVVMGAGIKKIVLIFMSFLLINSVYAIEPQEDFSGYMADLQGKIQKSWFPPECLERDGHALVKFSVARTGHIYSAQIVESSGDPVYDESALEALRKASPLAHFPASTSRGSLTIKYSFDTSVVNTGDMQRYLASADRFYNVNNRTALDYINKAIDEVDGDINAYFLYGKRSKIKEALGDTVGAAADLDQSMKLKARYDQKRIMASKLIAEMEQSPYSYFNLAHSYEVAGDYEHAIEAIEKAIALTELNNQYKRYKDELVTKKTSSL